MAGPMRIGINLASQVDEALQEGDFATAVLILDGVEDTAHHETLVVLLSNIKLAVKHIGDPMLEPYRRLYSATLLALRQDGWKTVDIDDAIRLLEIS